MLDLYAEKDSKESSESDENGLNENLNNKVHKVNWAKPPTLIDIKSDFTSARPIHTAQVNKIKIWLDNLNITGLAKITPVKGHSSVSPKLIRRQAEWRYASLSEPFLSTDDIFSVKPVTWEDSDAAKQNELLLNHQFNNKIDKVKFIDEYVRTAVDEGTVIVQVGWDYEDEEYEAEEPIVEYIVNPALAPLHQHIDKLKTESPSQYELDVPEELKEAHELTLENGKPIEPIIKGKQTVKKTRVLKNQPSLEVCDFRNIMLDPTAMGNLDKSNFIIKSFETSKADLKKSGKKYFDLDKIMITNASVLGAPDYEVRNGSEAFNYSDDSLKRFIAHEYWGKRDVNGDGILKTIVLTWVGETFIRMEETPFADKGLPFVIEHYLPVRKSNYGEPDGALLEENQKIIGAVTRGMIDIMGRSANGQTGISSNLMDITNRRKFDKGLDYEFNPNVDPRQGVYMHTYPEIPQSAGFMLQLHNQEAEALTGVQSFSQGISGAALGDVAAGVRGALDAASKRELGILRRLSSGIVKIGRKIICMNADFLTEKEVVRITNDDFVTVYKDSLGGAFDLKLSISTAEEDNNKAEQLAFMLQTTGSILGPEMAKLILADIARLRKLPALAHKIETYEAPPNEMEQKKQELELAYIQAKIAAEEAKAQAHQAAAQLDMARIQTESSKPMTNQATAELNMAKIGTEVHKQDNLRSNTDKNTLDFVEQQSGIKHDRELEHVGEQARSQGELSKLDHQLDTDGKQTDLLAQYISRQINT